MKVSMEKILIDIFLGGENSKLWQIHHAHQEKKVLLAVFMWQELSPVLLRCPSYVILLLMGSGLY